MQQLGVPNIAELNTAVDVELGDQLVDDGEVKWRVVEDERACPNERGENLAGDHA